MNKFLCGCFIAFITFAAASINFLLFESSLKYWFFGLEATLIFSLLFFSSNTKREVKLKVTIRSLLSTKYMGLAIFLLPLILLLFTLLRIYTILNLFLAIATSFFILGFVLLDLIGFNASRSSIEWLVLSFYLSIPINSLFRSFLILLPIESQQISLCILYTVLTFLIVVKRIKTDYKTIAENKWRIFSLNKNHLILGLTISFFFVSIVMTYPEMAYRPGLDIVRQYSASVLVNENPSSYSFPYPWFNFQLATLMLMSTQTMEVLQTILALLSVISIFSFYIMVKTYLNDLNDKLPAIATLLWALFSGFGWLYFLGLKLANFTDYSSLLSIANDNSYWDVGYGQGPWIWLWFRPLTLGVTGFFILLYLLKRTDIDNKLFFTLTYFTVLSLGMVHFSELVFYAMLLFTLSLIFTPVPKIRLKDSLQASLLAAISILGFLVFYNSIGLRIQFSIFEIVIPITFFALAILMVKLRQCFPNLRLPNLINTTYIYYFTSGLSVLWLVMLFYSFTNTENFHVSMVSPVLAVPWILYPMLLGICGMLTFSGIFYIAKHHRNHPIIIFVAIFIIGIIFGRLLTYINLHFFYTGYWERRFIPLTFSASAIIASFSVFYMIKKIQLRPIILPLLISLLVVGGLTSTALSIEYQISTTQKNMLTTDELTQIDLLNELSSDSYLLAFSSRSLQVGEYAPFAWRIGYFRHHIWSATSPELVLNTLFSTEHMAVIYLGARDYTELLTESYSEGYVQRHLLTIAPLFYDDTKASIYNLQTIAPPAENSNVVLVVPENSSNTSFAYAYDIMSSAGYNYTSAYIYDIQTLSKAKIIVVPNEILASKVLELKNDLQLNFNYLIVLNLDGYYGKFAKINYPSVNVELVSSDFGNASLQDPTSKQYEESTNVNSSGFTSFLLETVASNNSLILADDESSGFWSASATLEGNLSLPKLTDDPELKVSGENSLKIEVSNGSYAQWQISGEFGNITNLGAYDFISFYWYGEGNGVKYVVQVNTDIPSNYFWYEFTDSWTGWKKVILPMYVADGSYTLYGVSFTKVTKNEANWRSVENINFKLSGVNLNTGGIFHLDRFAFERSAIVDLKVEIHGNLQTFQLLNLNRNIYLPVVQINTNETVSISEYHLSNGLSSRSLLGKDVGNLTFTQFNDTYSEAFIRIKVPVASNRSYPVQSTFAIAPTYRMSKSSSVSGEWGTTVLPVEINLVPLESNANVMAHYDDEAKTFFMFKTSYDQVELTYLNFYPIINAFKIGSRELYSTIGAVTKSTLGNLSSYTYKNEPINAGNTAAFREAALRGNITVSFESIIFQTENNGSLEVTMDENAIYRLGSDEKISTANFTYAVMKTTYMEILPGNGFYIKASVKNATLKLYGAPVNLISFLNNYYINSSRGYVITIKMENATILFRKPVIWIDGEGSFKDLYTYHELNRRIGALGEDCEISGRITFTGVYGDTYSVTENFDYAGDVKLSEPLYRYDEWQSLVEMLPYLYIVAISYLIFAVQEILRKKE